MSASHPEDEGFPNMHCLQVVIYVVIGINLTLTEISDFLPMVVQDVGHEGNLICAKPSRANKGPGALKRKRKAPPNIDANPSLNKDSSS